MFSMRGGVGSPFEKYGVCLYMDRERLVDRAS